MNTRNLVWDGNLKRGLLGVGSGIAMAGLAISLVGAGQDGGLNAGPQRGREGVDLVMRQKLEFSQQILRGLALEDFAVMQTNAVRLGKLSEMTGWQVRNTPEYIGFSAEFRRVADELAYSAREKNLDGATIAYTQLTYSCVSCHKYMRGKTVEKTSHTPQ